MWKKWIKGCLFPARARISAFDIVFCKNFFLTCTLTWRAVLMFPANKKVSIGEMNVPN